MLRFLPCAAAAVGRGIRIIVVRVCIAGLVLQLRLEVAGRDDDVLAAGSVSVLHQDHLLRRAAQLNRDLLAERCLLKKHTQTQSASDIGWRHVRKMPVTRVGRKHTLTHTQSASLWNLEFQFFVTFSSIFCGVSSQL